MRHDQPFSSERRSHAISFRRSGSAVLIPVPQSGDLASGVAPDAVLEGAHSDGRHVTLTSARCLVIDEVLWRKAQAASSRQVGVNHFTSHSPARRISGTKLPPFDFASPAHYSRFRCSDLCHPRKARLRRSAKTGKRVQFPRCRATVSEDIALGHWEIPGKAADESGSNSSSLAKPGDRRDPSTSTSFACQGGWNAHTRCFIHPASPRFGSRCRSHR
jgi:hypothetical protein